jgi:2-phosphosulfolactate phosphatase
MPMRIITAEDKSNLKWAAVCMSPALIHQFPLENAIVVVIDVLRATTSMCVAFEYGAKSIVPVVSIEDCMAYKEKGYLVAAERNGEQQEGFDFGNSPYSYMQDKIKGRDIAMTTTNGTKCIELAVKGGAKEIVVGSFANLSVLAEYLLKRNENVVLFCSGWKDRLNLEDTIFAGAMVRKLWKNLRLYEDSTLIAEALYRSANRRKRFFMFNSSHFNRMIHLRIQKDVKFSLRRDTCPVIPQLQDGRLINILPVEEPVRLLKRKKT